MNIELNNIKITSSLQNVLMSGYYSNARFVLQAYYDLFRKDTTTNWRRTYIPFNKGSRSMYSIFYVLKKSMDIAFRNALGQNINSDYYNRALFDKSIKLFRPKNNLPDGSALYGLLLNSHGVAVGGFGEASKPHKNAGNKIIINDLDVQNLKLEINEVPIIHFSKCHNEELTKKIVDKYGFKGMYLYHSCSRSFM